LRLLRVFLALSVCTLLTGCTDSSSRSQEKQEEAAKFQQDLTASIATDQYLDNQDIETTLANAAASVTKSLDQLAKIERAVHPKAKLPPQDQAVQMSMPNLVTVDWTGPIEPIIRRIAMAADYELVILGRRPSIPVLVSLNVHDTPLATILRDIDYQSQQRATIEIYPEKKRIELRYTRA
jgi:defect-in-organelle-trafficking protein DotD